MTRKKKNADTQTAHSSDSEQTPDRTPLVTRADISRHPPTPGHVSTQQSITKPSLSQPIMPLAVRNPSTAHIAMIQTLNSIPPNERPFELIAALIDSIMTQEWILQSEAFRQHYRHYGPFKKNFTTLGKRRAAAVTLYYWLGIHGPMLPYNTLFNLCETIQKHAKTIEKFGAPSILSSHEEPLWIYFLYQRFRIRHPCQWKIYPEDAYMMENPDFTSAPELKRFNYIHKTRPKASTSSSPCGGDEARANVDMTFVRRPLSNSFYMTMTPFFNSLDRFKMIWFDRADPGVFEVIMGLAEYLMYRRVRYEIKSNKHVNDALPLSIRVHPSGRITVNRKPPSSRSLVFNVS